jgi:hypothetical protein
MPQRYPHLAPEQFQNTVKLLIGVIGEKTGIGRAARCIGMDSRLHPNSIFWLKNEIG